MVGTRSRTPSRSGSASAPAGTGAAGDAKSGTVASASKRGSRWFSDDPVIAWNERMFLYLGVYWIGIMAVVVATGMYEHFCNWGYTIVGLLIAVPHVLVPALFSHPEEARVPWYNRFGLKANAFIAAFGYVGNFFWTHYFFNLLDARYTFCHTWNLNGIPVCLWLITQAYFLLYHTLSNMLIRRVTALFRSRVARIAAEVVLVLVFSYIVALMEAVTISGFPYYSIGDRRSMYLYGSAFYAIYFIVSFPAYYRLSRGHSLFGAARDGLAAAMMVFIMLDWWRLGIGAITHRGSAHTVPYAQAVH